MLCDQDTISLRFETCQFANLHKWLFGHTFLTSLLEFAEVGVRPLTLKTTSVCADYTGYAR
jgi:hypothetical protein